MEDRIELDKLQLELEPNHDEDKVLIFTTMGIYKPGVPLGHKCSIAELHCGDTEDEDDSAYQIGALFKAAPKLLATGKALLAASSQHGLIIEGKKKHLIALSAAENALTAAVAAAEEK